MHVCVCTCSLNKIRDNKWMGIASTKSQINTHFAKFKIEYLGYWMTQQGIQPLPKRVEALTYIAPAKNKKQL